MFVVNPVAQPVSWVNPKKKVNPYGQPKNTVNPRVNPKNGQPIRSTQKMVNPGVNPGVNPRVNQVVNPMYPNFIFERLIKQMRSYFDIDIF